MSLILRGVKGAAALRASSSLPQLFFLHSGGHVIHPARGEGCGRPERFIELSTALPFHSGGHVPVSAWGPGEFLLLPSFCERPGAGRESEASFTSTSPVSAWGPGDLLLLPWPWSVPDTCRNGHSSLAPPQHGWGIEKNKKTKKIKESKNKNHMSKRKLENRKGSRKHSSEYQIILDLS